MDIIILFIGFVFLAKRKYDWVIFIILLLSSNYMQMRLPLEFIRPTFPFPHQILDTSLLLYLCLYFKVISNRKMDIRLSQTIGVVLLFFYFLIAAIMDVSRNVEISDILFYLRGYLLLTFIFIAGSFSYDVILKVLKKVYYATATICLIILFQRFTNIELIPFIPIDLERGVKAPIFAIFCSFLSLINVFKVSRPKQIAHVIVFLLPILLNSKMTYLLSIVLIYVLYLIIKNGVNVVKSITYIVLVMIFLNIVLVLFPTISERIMEIQGNLSTIGTENAGDNFSFRMAHAYERLMYVLNGGFFEWFHGVGFINERNFKSGIFTIGLLNEEHNIIQLDTGDIAWSILFVRFGIVGTLIFIFFLLRLIIQLLKLYGVCKLFGCYLLVALFFQSLGNAVLVDGFFYILPLLFLGCKKNSALLVLNSANK